jgi:hypothetical protein
MKKWLITGLMLVSLVSFVDAARGGGDRGGRFGGGGRLGGDGGRRFDGDRASGVDRGRFDERRFADGNRIDGDGARGNWDNRNWGFRGAAQGYGWAPYVGSALLLGATAATLYANQPGWNYTTDTYNNYQVYNWTNPSYGTYSYYTDENGVVWVWNPNTKSWERLSTYTNN